jgi:hypothetical protein
MEGTMDTQPDDVMAIKALIARQFGSLCWTASSPADWDGFARDFLDGATLFPAARPAASQAWDRETPANPIPQRLMTDGSA